MSAFSLRTFAIVTCIFTGALSAATVAPSGNTIIETDQAPPAIGPYSQAVLVGNTLYLAGQIAIDPETGELITGDIERETRLVLENLGAVLRAAGFGYADVVMASVFLTDMADFPAMNRIYAEYFPENPPARATVAVKALPRGVSVEIAFIAARP